MTKLLRFGLGLLVVLALTWQLGHVALATLPAPGPAPVEPDCNPCVTVVDKPAWDETQTVVDRPAYDETVTVVDTPASTGTRTVVDVPAHSVAHHDLVSPATTVARQVLVTAGYYQNVATLVPGHYEYGQVWTPSGYWTYQWISAGYWTQQWISSGYWGWQWQSSGYWGSQYVYSGYWASQYVPSGYWSYQWISTGGYWDYDCDDFRCWRYWESTGYYTTVWIDTSYYTTSWIDTSYWQSVWIDTSHWQSVWVDNSYWQSVWIDTSHYEQRWVDTSSYQPGAVWVGDRYITAATYVPSGYMGFHCYWDDGERDCESGWISTAYWAYPNQAWVPPVYATVYDVVPAVYNDWIEQVAAITHTETYTIPAVTHQATVHHDALTHTVTVHHDALTHQEQAPSVTSQSTQGAPSAANGDTSGSAGTATAPVTIPVVSTITLIDHPATTRTITVVDQPAYDTTRTVVDQAAWDQTVSTPVWDYDCDDTCHRYVDHFDTTVVHHDAVTHQEAVHVPAVTHTETQSVSAVTHTETLRYDAIVGQASAGGTGGPVDDLLALATLAGLVALSGAGRYASRTDALKVAAAEWTAAGNQVPAAVAPLLEDDASTANAVESAIGTDTNTIDAGLVETLTQDTPPSSEDSAGARSAFEAWLAGRETAKPTSSSDGGIFDVPLVGGVMRGLDWLNNAAFETPVGFAALAADTQIDTGLTARVDARMAAENRPFWERGVVAQQELGKALQQIAEDPNADGLDRALAQTTRVTEFIGQFASGNELGRGGVELLRDGIGLFGEVRAAGAVDVAASDVYAGRVAALRDLAASGETQEAAEGLNSIVSEIVASKAAELAADFSKALDNGLLSPREYAAFLRGDMQAANFGKAVQEATFSEIAESPSLREVLKDTHLVRDPETGRFVKSPDLTGQDAFSGTTIDITSSSRTSQLAHSTRYGDDLLQATYAMPDPDELAGLGANASSGASIGALAAVDVATATNETDTGASETGVASDPPDFSANFLFAGDTSTDESGSEGDTGPAGPNEVSDEGADYAWEDAGADAYAA